MIKSPVRGHRVQRPAAPLRGRHPNIASHVGLGAAVDYLSDLGMAHVAARETELLAHATEELRKIEGLRIIGTASEAAVVSFLVDGAHAHDLATLLDLDGVAVRSGHHCAHPLMQWYGVPATCRASFAFYNTHADVEAFAAALRKARACSHDRPCLPPPPKPTSTRSSPSSPRPIAAGQPCRLDHQKPTCWTARASIPEVLRADIAATAAGWCSPNATAPARLRARGVDGDAGYFGMFSVVPGLQGGGIDSRCSPNANTSSATIGACRRCG